MKAKTKMLMATYYVLASLVSLSRGASPMIDQGVMLRIPVTLLNETHFFVLDTGSSATVLDNSLLPRLGTPGGKVIVETPYQSPLSASLYTIPGIVIGDATLQFNHIACIDLHMAQLICGEPCSGVLGMDVLSNYVVTMQFDANSLLLGHQGGAINNPDAVSIPLVPVKGNRFGINIVLNGSHNMTLMIDSGSSMSVSLNKHDWDELYGKEAETVGRTSYFTGAGNAIRQSRVARLGSLKVGSLLYSNLLCEQLPNPESVSHLGLGFLRQNFAILDFPKKTLNLAKRSKLVSEEDDMSGLHLLSEGGAVVIYAVDVGSPAESAGLRAGDQIVSINGKPSSELRMEQIRYLFEAGDGKRVETTVKRDGKNISTRVTLKRFV